MILDCNDEDFLYNESICGFVARLCLQRCLVYPWNSSEHWQKKNSVEWKTALANKLQNTLPL